MLSADVKTNVKQLVAVSLHFYKKYHENVKYKEKRACIIYLILVGIPSNLMLFV